MCACKGETKEEEKEREGERGEGASAVNSFRHLTKRIYVYYLELVAISSRGNSSNAILSIAFFSTSSFCFFVRAAKRLVAPEEENQDGKTTADESQRVKFDQSVECCLLLTI